MLNESVGVSVMVAVADSVANDGEVVGDVDTAAVRLAELE